jgi:hypothetical protein
MPQNGLVRPYSYTDVNQFEVGPHSRILNTQYDIAKYKEVTNVVISESANLTPEKKLKSELFEDKVRSILGSVMHIVDVSSPFQSFSVLVSPFQS